MTRAPAGMLLWRAAPLAVAAAFGPSCDEDSSSDRYCDSRESTAERDVPPGVRRVDVHVRVGEALGEDERFVFGEFSWTFARAASDACRIGIYRGAERPSTVPAAAVDEALPERAGTSVRIFEGVLPPTDDPQAPREIGLGRFVARNGPELGDAIITPETTNELWLTAVVSCDGLHERWQLREYHYRCPDPFVAQLVVEEE